MSIKSNEFWPSDRPAEETGQAQGCGCTVTMTCAYHGASESASRFGGSDVGPPAAEGARPLGGGTTDWYQAALRVGEELASVGPEGYYQFTAAQWRDWCLSRLSPTPSARLDEIAREAAWGLFEHALLRRSHLEPAEAIIRRALDAARGAE